MPFAARVGDFHISPLFIGPMPVVGGPILPPGAPTVLVGGMPAATLSGMAATAGPPDVIVGGSTTVMAGSLPLARMTDPTAQGGMIVLGCFTVNIGG